MSLTSTTPTASLYEQVTQRIIEALENGVVPWERPWSTIGAPRNAATGHQYRGVNVLLTQVHAMQHGHSCADYVTFLQAKANGGYVRRGEKGVGLVMWKQVTKSVESELGDEEEATYWFARTFTAFNLDQTEGLDHLRRVVTSKGETQPNADAEAIIEGSPAPIHWGGDRAFYSPDADSITLPRRASFTSMAGLYSTAFHELAHSTGHATRLNRDLTGRFGSDRYCVEELVAELAASFVCARVGVDHISQSAAYIGAWVRVLKGDDRAVLSAAKLATQAADFLTTTALLSANNAA
jgi:antirestriction protein ArdC